MSDIRALALANKSQSASFPVDKLNFTVSKSKNLFNKLTCTDNYLLEGTNGRTTFWVGNSASDYIAIKPNTQYTSNNSFNYAWYDANKVYISGANNAQNTGYTITSPSNAAYIRLNVNSLGKNSYQFEQGASSTPYTPFSPTIDPQYALQIPSISRMVWNSLGDSITAARTYQEKVMPALGITTLGNFGVGGTTIADKTGSDTTAMVNRYTSMTDADLITVMGGTNDWGGNAGIPLSSADPYDKKTFKGALRVLIEGLLTKYPGKVIIFMTPPQRYSATYSVDANGINVNNLGASVKDFADAMLEICSYYGIPCIDVFRNCGWSKFNINTFTSDGTHPIDIGHQRIASLLISEIKRHVV